MVRLKPLVGLLLLAVSCAPSKAPTDKQPELLGRPLSDWSTEWISASVDTESGLTQKQKDAFALLEPAGGEGRIGLGFTEDFDGDGRVESVAYGQYEKKDEQGNFVLVTRKEGDRTAVLLLKELPGPPQFTVFTLKPDGSLRFGGGIDAGEVTMNITWEGGVPTYHKLTAD